MPVEAYEYRMVSGDDDILAAAWVEAEDWPEVSLTGLLPGRKYAFQTRSKDEAGIYSNPTPVFYQTTPYVLGLLTYGDGDVMTGDGSHGLGTLVGHYLEAAV